jgi:hypothetical protein
METKPTKKVKLLKDELNKFVVDLLKEPNSGLVEVDKDCSKSFTGKCLVIDGEYGKECILCNTIYDKK